MKRLVILTSGAAFLLSAGCTHDWSIRKALDLGPDTDVRRTSPLVKGASEAMKLTPEQLALAERVNLIGRQIVVQNTFTGIEPVFTVHHVKEQVLFHNGTEQLCISAGIVEKCKTDAELAAVLCAEMGKMVAEKRGAKAVGRDVDPIPDVNYGGNSVFGGGNALDVSQQANLAFHEKRYPRGAKDISADATNTARELLKGAGYSPAELDRVEVLLKQSERGEKLQKQMSASAPEPTWIK